MAKDPLGPWRSVFESLKKHVESTVPIEPTAPSVLEAAVNDRNHKDIIVHLDLSLVSPRKEPDLHLPDPHDVWHLILKEAEREGDFDMVQTAL